MNKTNQKNNKSVKPAPLNLNAVKNQQFVTYEEGAKLYRLGLNKFMELARDAGACYKFNRRVIVNLAILDEYLETFRLEA